MDLRRNGLSSSSPIESRGIRFDSKFANSSRASESRFNSAKNWSSVAGPLDNRNTIRLLISLGSSSRTTEVLRSTRRIRVPAVDPPSSLQRSKTWAAFRPASGAVLATNHFPPLDFGRATIGSYELQRDARFYHGHPGHATVSDHPIRPRRIGDLPGRTRENRPRPQYRAAKNPSTFERIEQAPSISRLFRPNLPVPSMSDSRVQNRGSPQVSTSRAPTAILADLNPPVSPNVQVLERLFRKAGKIARVSGLCTAAAPETIAGVGYPTHVPDSP